jgi:RNA polymerase sigma-B factor
MDSPPDLFDEENELFRELVATQRVELRDQLVAKHLGLAHHIARRFINRGEPFDDLFQVASMALVKAVDRFDPERGIKFNTFAVPYMVGELKRHFRDKGWAVRAPRRIQELYLELGQQVEDLTHTLGRSPTVIEIAAALNEPVSAVLEAMEANRHYRADSLDDPREESSESHALAADEEDLALIEARTLLVPALKELTPAEQDLIRMRFIDDMTQSQIAKRIGISQMQVSRLLAQSLKRLRSQMGDSNVSPLKD